MSRHPAANHGQSPQPIQDAPAARVISSAEALTNTDHRQAMIGNALTSLLQATGVAVALFYTVDGRLQKFTEEVIVARAEPTAAPNLEASLTRYRRRYYSLDPFAPRRLATNQTRLIDSASLPDAEVQARSPYFAEYLSELGMSGQTTLLIRCDGRITAGIDLLRRDAGPIATGQLAFLLTSQAMLEHAYDCALHAKALPAGERLAVAQPLTRREAEVVRLVARGASNREVATALTISEATVKTHLMHAFEKLSVRSRAQLISLLASERDTPLAVA